MSEHTADSHGHGDESKGNGTVTFSVIVGTVIFLVIMSLWTVIWLASPGQDSVRYLETYPYMTLIQTLL
jgi:hypothetical protein